MNKGGKNERLKGVREMTTEIEITSLLFPSQLYSQERTIRDKQSWIEKKK